MPNKSKLLGAIIVVMGVCSVSSYLDLGPVSVLYIKLHDRGKIIYTKEKINKSRNKEQRNFFE